jgi:hypothetical protein
MRTRYVTFDVHKKYFDDIEMKEPLNHSMETYSPAPLPPKKDIHIATWDEFSMVSATLGRKFYKITSSLNSFHRFDTAKIR